MTVRIDAKLEETLTCGLKNERRNLAEHSKVSKLGL